jgi:hypothetical protein
MPGIPTGKHALGESEPAFPKEQDSPGSSGSKNVTRCPSRCSHAAVQVPTIPVPMTAMCMGYFPISSGQFYLGYLVFPLPKLILKYPLISTLQL